MLLLTVVALLYYYERDHIGYYFTGMAVAGQPTPCHITAVVMIREHCGTAWELVDFGCATGDFIATVESYVGTVVGVELDCVLARRARSRLIYAYPRIQVVGGDMAMYSFREVPTLLYMYEPLWLASRRSARHVYAIVLQRLVGIKQPIRVIYVTGNRRQHADPPFFARFGLHLVSQVRVRRGLGWWGNRVYLFMSRSA